MGLTEKHVNAGYLGAATQHPTTKKLKTAVEVCVAADADAQDEALWERTFAATQDTLSRLAAQSRVHREAGRTKKISA